MTLHRRFGQVLVGIGIGIGIGAAVQFGVSAAQQPTAPADIQAPAGQGPAGQAPAPAGRMSISLRSATNSMGFVRSASAPPSRAFRLVLSSP